MTVNDTPKPQGAGATPQRSFLARSALLAGGATTGLVASALAGFGLVSLMFPNSGLPGTGGAPLTAAAYLPAPVSVTVMPETTVARIDRTPVPAAIYRPEISDDFAAEPASVAPSLRRDEQVAAEDVTVAPASATPVVAARPDAPAETRPVVATKNGPVEQDAPVIDTTSFGPRLAALPAAREHAAAAPAPAEPDAFAMLADDDAAARAEAGLFASVDRSTRGAPSAAPQSRAVTPEPVRPARRPEGFADQLAAYEPPASSAAPARSIRPAARPEIILAAAKAPVAAPSSTSATAGNVAPPTNVVEVSARQKSGGFLSGGSSSCGRALARAIPSRKGGATGSAFFAGLTNVSGPQRDAQIIAELARGNMPSHLRDLQPVTFRGQDSRGADVEITICVTPDYLALGSDRDYVRVPLGLPAAARVAGAFNMTLPTPRMVDAIYAQANVKLSPSPMTPGSQMSTTSYFVTHNATIQQQLKGRRGLVAGHKKDVVMASRMASAPGRVAIYGWHRKSGAPIQPVSTVHGANYADYSHGIRLVSKTAYLNGKAVSLDDLLGSGRYAYLLNTDGPMPGPVIRTASN